MGVAIEIGPLGESQADARGVLVSQPVENVEPPLSELATTGELRGEVSNAYAVRTGPHRPEGNSAPSG